MGEIEEIKERLSDVEDRLTALERSLDGGDTEPREKKLSINEFALEFDPSNHRERALVIGHYLENHDGVDSFTTKDIREGYRRIKWNPPANPSDTVSKAVSQGQMMEVGKTEKGAKEYVLTQTGEQMVDEMRDNE